MSFCDKSDTCIKEGDTVVLYLSFNDMRPLVVKPGQTQCSKFGSVKHADLVGKQFGARLLTSTGRHCCVLRATPELWTLCLPHRTQIIYTPNISMIALQLELKPGSVVIESGKCALLEQL